MIFLKAFNLPSSRLNWLARVAETRDNNILNYYRFIVAEWQLPWWPVSGILVFWWAHVRVVSSGYFSIRDNHSKSFESRGVRDLQSSQEKTSKRKASFCDSSSAGHSDFNYFLRKEGRQNSFSCHQNII